MYVCTHYKLEFMESDLSSKDGYAALRIKDFRRYIYARFLLTFAIQMQSVVVGWQIYQLTHDPLSLGLIGMSEALPFFAWLYLQGMLPILLIVKK